MVTQLDMWGPTRPPRTKRKGPALRTCARAGCGKTYTYVRGSGSGYTYCSDDCKLQAGRAWQDRQRIRPVCDLCGNRATNWWRIAALCADCYAILRPAAQTLQRHHVPSVLLRHLVNNQTCWNDACDVHLFTPQRNYRGDWTIPLNVDHDHNCCPGSLGCERCVRGFLCGHCNKAEGQLRGDATIAEGLARYMRTRAGWT